MPRLRFSANLGFLWKDLPLPDAISAAGASGFDAVECHWPFDVPPETVQDALKETGLPMLGLNTRRGDPAAGEFGFAAIAGREAEARAGIDEAIAYAAAISARHVHVMAGRVRGAAARETFIANLGYACDIAAPHGLRIVIEPINEIDVPGYFLTKATQAETILEAVERPNLAIMFDIYHAARMTGDPIRDLVRLLPRIAHIQFADAPGRGAPGTGALDWRHVFEEIERSGYAGFVGAEYDPGGETGASLGWLEKRRTE